MADTGLVYGGSICFDEWPDNLEINCYTDIHAYGELDEKGLSGKTILEHIRYPQLKWDAPAIQQFCDTVQLGTTIIRSFSFEDFLTNAGIPSLFVNPLVPTKIVTKFNGHSTFVLQVYFSNMMQSKNPNWNWTKVRETSSSSSLLLMDPITKSNNDKEYFEQRLKLHPLYVFKQQKDATKKAI